MTKWALKLNLEILLLVLLIGFSFFIRIVNLGFPDHKIFDEVYRVTRAQMFLHDQPFFTPQPHLGRYLIMLGILLCGDNPIGWRITSVFSGTLLVVVLYLIGKKLFSHKHAGLLTLFFATFSSNYLAYSRIGIVIIHLAFFIALALLFFILATENNNKNSKSFFCFSAIVAGLAIAIKWTALVLLPIFFLWIVLKANLKNTLLTKLSSSALFLVIIAFTYLLTFSGEARNHEYLHQRYKMPNSNFIESIISWHKLAFKTHINTNNRHPCASKWYTWPLMYKPVLLHWQFDSTRSKQITTILGIGNPVLWWAKSLAILFCLFMLFFKRDKTIIFLLGAYFISFLPYAFIKRPMFLYHYLPSVIFSTLVLEYTFANLYKERKYLRPLLVSFIILIVGAFFYFYPFANGYSVSISEYKSRLWFKSWSDYTSIITKYIDPPLIFSNSTRTNNT